MQLHVIMDQNGRATAACKVGDGPGPTVGIQPATPDHILHRIELPQNLAVLPLRDIVRRIQLDANRAPVIGPG